MGILDRLFGRRADDRPAARTAGVDRRSTAAGTAARPARSEDEQAVERYRYLLRTAPPETIEEAHAEAFARLSPEQRRLVLQDLSAEVPGSELAGSRANPEDPRALARLATRAELRNPGTLERTWNRSGANAGLGGVGLGGLMAGSFLSTVAGVVVGTAIADAFFGDAGYDQVFEDGAPAAEDAGADTAAEDSGFDQFDADAGGDFGDFGGGDFGDF
jgi:hypothetical protein